MFRRGGGVIDIQCEYDIKILKIFVLIDVKDSMGANTINTVLEGLAPRFEKVFQGERVMSILSNLSPERLIKANIKIPFEFLKFKDISGEEVAKRIVQLNTVAKFDYFLAQNLNKPILDVIQSLSLALGQDSRATKVSFHSFNVYKNGFYGSFGDFKVENNHLIAELELPFQMGTKGGAIGSNSLYRFCMRILKNPTTQELGALCISLALVHNFFEMSKLVISKYKGIPSKDQRYIRSTRPKSTIPIKFSMKTKNAFSKKRVQLNL